MIELNPEDREKIREAYPKISSLIIKNIFKAATEGKILTDRQIEMIRLAAMSDTPEPSAGAPPADFALDMTVPSDYVGAGNFYGVTDRTIKRWVKAGREQNIPCPYTEPAKMADWWVATHKKPVPDEITAAVAKVTAVPKPAAAPAATLPVLDMSQFDPASFNYDAGLMAQRTVMMVQRQRYLDACATTDETRQRKAMQDFLEAAEAVRKAEKDSARIQEQQGDTLRKAAVHAVLTDIHGNVRRRFKATLLEALAPLALNMTPEERNAWADDVVDRACRRLVDSRFIETAKAA